MDENKKYLVALSYFHKFGPNKIYKLKQYFNNYKQAFLADTASLLDAGIEKTTVDEFQIFKTNLNPDKIALFLEKENIQIIEPEDKNYSEKLKQIYRPPQILYYKGALKNKESAVAVVGSRNSTTYGKQVTQNIVAKLSQQKICIVSGLALGIDSVAHNTALENKGRTIAVLGTGIDKQSIYPSQNRYLFDKIIAEGGAVISEFPPGMAPLRYNFPQRNRIISGLSLGVLVVEAKEKSGALITAKYALEQNRDIFAVPGNIFSPLSAGANKLIKQGATPISSAEDIMDALDLELINNYIDNKIIPTNKEEEKIIALLDFEPKHINEIIRESKMEAKAINSLLSIMEMKGMIKNLGNMQYVLLR